MTLTCRKRPTVVAVCSLLIATLLSLSSASEVRAFIPRNSLTFGGSIGVSHQEITKRAFLKLMLNHFSVVSMTAGMEGALKTISDANVEVDQDQFHSAKHFDGESFPEGQQRLRDLREFVAGAMSRADVNGARQALGSALHTVQDFYSHSNWVEMGYTVPHPQLGRAGAIERLEEWEQTCQTCPLGQGIFIQTCLACRNSADVISYALTSGYYGGEDRLKPGGKCSHGGQFDGSASSLKDGINKDSTQCDLSPHFYLHEKAVALAVEASVQFMADVKSDLTLEQAASLFGLTYSESLAFVVDVSLKMKPNLPKVAEIITKTAEGRQRSTPPIGLWVLNTFDRFEFDKEKSTSLGGLLASLHRRVINAQTPVPTADCTQLNTWLNVNGAVLDMVGGGDLYVYTNAVPVDADEGMIRSVTYNAQRLRVRINLVDPGGCPATDVDPSFIRVAHDTGGRVFALEPSTMADVEPLSNLVATPEPVNLLLAHNLPAGIGHSYTVPVDSTLTRLTFSISRGLPLLWRPDGSPILLLGGLFAPQRDGGIVYSVADPMPGNWSVTVLGSGSFSLKVSGESTLNLSSFKFLTAGGRLGHESFFPITGSPLVGEPSMVEAEISDGVTEVQFDLRDENGAFLQTLLLAPVDGVPGKLFGQFTPPPAPFRLYLTGRNAGGVTFQRALPGTVRPQTVKVDAPAAQELQRGKTSTYTFRITNRGPSGPFTVTATDDRSYVTSISPADFSLGTNQSRDVTVSLEPPADTEPGTSDALTLNVAGTSGTANNFATVTSLVTLANDPPDLSGARPSVARLWPTNRNMTEISLLGVTDPDGDAVTLQIEGITSDEATNGQGDGDTCPDASGIGAASAQLRAERSGKGDGRVYTVAFRASDGKGGISRGSIKVCVPHNNGRDCVDSGQRFGATSCPIAASDPRKGEGKK